MSRQSSSEVVRPIEQTLALIKPSGMEFREEILQKIFMANFKIIETKICKLHPGQVCELFKYDWDSKHYPKSVESLADGPIQAMCLARPNAIRAFLTLFGLEPGADKKFWVCGMRGCFGSIDNDVTNALHGSINSDTARWEIQYFFPDVIVHPIMTCPITQREYLNLRVYPKLFEGLYAIAKKRPHDPITELAYWLLMNNPGKPVAINDQYDEASKLESNKINDKNFHTVESIV